MSRLGTPDLDAAIRFATEIVGLQLVAREGNAAYFRSDKVDVRGDTRDHTLVYFEGDPADQTIGFELIDPDDLDRRRRGTGTGRAVPSTSAPRAECEQPPRHARSSPPPIPAATRSRSWRGPTTAALRYFPARDAGITNFSHIALFSTDAKRDEKFWTTICQCARLRLARRIALPAHRHRASLGRAFAVVAARHPAHQPSGRGYRRRDAVLLLAEAAGLKIVYGPGRHPISTAMMVYFEGPDGMVYEYSVGVKHILPEEEADASAAAVLARAVQRRHVGLAQQHHRHARGPARPVRMVV